MTRMAPVAVRRAFALTSSVHRTNSVRVLGSLQSMPIFKFMGEKYSRAPQFIMSKCFDVTLTKSEILKFKSNPCKFKYKNRNL